MPCWPFLAQPHHLSFIHLIQPTTLQASSCPWLNSLIRGSAVGDISATLFIRRPFDDAAWRYDKQPGRLFRALHSTSFVIYAELIALMGISVTGAALLTTGILYLKTVILRGACQNTGNCTMRRHVVRQPTTNDARAALPTTPFARRFHTRPLLPRGRCFFDIDATISRFRTVP